MDLGNFSLEVIILGLTGLAGILVWMQIASDVLRNLEADWYVNASPSLRQLVYLVLALILPVAAFVIAHLTGLQPITSLDEVWLFGLALFTGLLRTDIRFRRLFAGIIVETLVGEYIDEGE